MRDEAKEGGKRAKYGQKHNQLIMTKKKNNLNINE